MRVRNEIFVFLFLVNFLFSTEFISLKWAKVENIKKAEKKEELTIPVLKISSEENIFDIIKSKGVKLENFLVYPAGIMPKLKARGYIGADEKNLIIYLESEKSEKYNLKGRKYEKEEGKIWNDDNFEIFIDPFKTEKRYYHLIINSIGEIYDSICFIKEIPDPRETDPRYKKKEIVTDLSWSSMAKVKTYSDKNWWGSLIIIPFSSFGFDKIPVGSIFGLNLCRNYWETNELLQWKLTPGELGFHQPDKFGVVKIGDTDLNKLKISFFSPFIGYGKNIVYLNYEKDKKLNKGNVEIAIEDLFSRKKTVLKEETILLKKGKGKIGIPFENKNFGEYIIYYSAIFENISFVDIDFVNIKDIMNVFVENQFLYEKENLKGKVKINLGEVSWKETFIKFKLNQMEREEKIKGNLLNFEIDNSFIKEGENILSITIYENGNKIGEFETKIFKLPSI
jgi:hypothetical protein